MLKIFNYTLAVLALLSACSSKNNKKTKRKPVEDLGVYIEVPANTDLKVPAFRVMKYEAKNDGFGNPVSTEAKTPWVNISQTDAWKACDRLNSEKDRINIDNDLSSDGTYALISNPEWMTIARNIELVDKNWNGGSVGEGCIYKGNAGPVSEEEGCGNPLPYYKGPDPDFGADRSDKASLSLSNDEEIWDFSGNVHEWVDWDMTNTLATVDPNKKAYNSDDGGPVEAPFLLFTELDRNIEEDGQMPPSSWSPTGTYEENFAVGVYYGGNSLDGGAATRGGVWSDDLYAGPFALDLFFDSSDYDDSVGFRCVHRPVED